MGLYERNRRIAREHKAMVGCEVCGETNPTVLDFHHRDPTQKKFKVSSFNGPVKELLEEIDKCAVLCSNDHRRLHAGEITLPPHGQMDS